jgi:hypothetical protein
MSDGVLRKWLNMWFVPTTEKDKCFSRSDLFKAYINYQADKVRIR